MRILFGSLLALSLTACSTPSPQPQSQPNPTAPPFAMPMDPGMIPCSAIGNPTALREASTWATGRARAKIMAGAAPSMADPQTIAAALTTFCTANPTATVSQAAGSIGL